MNDENLIKTVTKGEVQSVPFGGSIKEIGFSISDWQKSYLINGSYSSVSDDGSVFGSKTNNERIKNGLNPI